MPSSAEVQGAFSWVRDIIATTKTYLTDMGFGVLKVPVNTPVYILIVFFLVISHLGGDIQRLFALVIDPFVEVETGGTHGVELGPSSV